MLTAIQQNQCAHHLKIKNLPNICYHIDIQYSKMGNTCQMDTSSPSFQNQIHFLPYMAPSQDKKYVKNCTGTSIRFGEVEKIRSSSLLESNKYCFMMPIRNSDELLRIEMPIVVSYSDQLNIKTGILKGDDIVDRAVMPQIIDTLDQETNLQIYHNFSVSSSEQQQKISYFSAKVYPFKNYYDETFKNAVNEAVLYKHMDCFYNSANSSLKQIFILERGIPSAMVFVHSLHLCTLFDVLLYRKNANLPYMRNEQNYLVYQVLNKYRNLRNNGIAHRDIRPSKIYLADPGYSIDSNGVRRGGDGRTVKAGYQFLNLQSARRYSQKQKIQDDLMQSVKGVQVYSSPQIIEYHQRSNQMGSYNAFENDRVQLAKLFLCIMTLQPYFEQDGQEERIKGTKQHKQWQKKMKKINEVLFDIITKLMTDSQKQQPIQKLINLLSMKSVPVETILESDHKIATNLLPKLFRKAHCDRIQTSRLQAMFNLHQRQQITTKLSQRIDENYRERRYYENVEILDRMGRYYQGVGVVNNDYYREEVNLLLELIEEERVKGFQTTDMLAKANEIYGEKMAGKNGKSSVTYIKLAMENSYELLSKGKEDQAKRAINNAFRTAGETDTIPVSLQLKLLQARGQIQSKYGDPMIAEDMFEKGLQQCSKQRNFQTQYERLDTKSTFQYLLAANILKMLRQQKRQMQGYQNPSIINARVKSIGKCDVLLQSARNTKTQIPGGSPVKLGKVYEGLGDLALFKENYKEGVGFYERTYRMYSNSDDYYVSDDLKLGILEKMHKVYLNSEEDITEQQRIKSKIKQLRKKQQKYNKSPKSNFSKLKSLAEKNRTHKNKPDYDIIAEEQGEFQEDQSKRFPSARKKQPSQQQSNEQSGDKSIINRENSQVIDYNSKNNFRQSSSSKFIMDDDD